MIRRLWRGQVPCILLSIFFSISAVATPPDYRSFNRQQSVSRQLTEESVLRVWMIYVGQGDGILIQLPRSDYEAPDEDWIDGGPINPTVDVMIDAGQSDDANEFLAQLYPGARTIEHLIVSHHDFDHVGGVSALLNDPAVYVDVIYHNGLATFLPGRNLPGGLATPAGNTCPANHICKLLNGSIQRAMGRVRDSNGAILSGYLISSFTDLESRFNRGHFQGVYRTLANSVVNGDMPAQIADFVRLRDGDVIDIGDGPVSLDVLWPRQIPRQYGGRNWGETINGNSVTLKLTYGDFQMLFTGDHNEHSQEDFLEYLEENGRLSDLEADVLKVPHHGSRHGLEQFFRHPQMNSVINVASMGSKGFRSRWKHPSEDAIRWSGGPHRFYSTHIHEKRFSYDDLSSRNAFDSMEEEKHILIETDGTWFRVVEIPIDSPNLLPAPGVRAVRRSHGTRWICASNNC